MVSIDSPVNSNAPTTHPVCFACQIPNEGRGNLVFPMAAGPHTHNNQSTKTTWLEQARLALEDRVCCDGVTLSHSLQRVPGSGAIKQHSLVCVNSPRKPKGLERTDTDRALDRRGNLPTGRFRREPSLCNSLSTTNTSAHLAPPNKNGTARKRQTDYLTPTLRCFLKNLSSPFHPPPSISFF